MLQNLKSCDMLKYELNLLPVHGFTDTVALARTEEFVLFGIFIISEGSNMRCFAQVLSN